MPLPIHICHHGWSHCIHASLCWRLVRCWPWLSAVGRAICYRLHGARSLQPSHDHDGQLTIALGIVHSDTECSRCLSMMACDWAAFVLTSCTSHWL
ncbi:unnamed protein product [Vitrella brassicaformis CCMP3155]|uniref:Cysteine dioxygenase n=1 Tax=Vitrella brassicaformis (strain CCMP3155) TaxID=1169540 RepID=A0A0G4G8G2_VITBC|nr:unnamed protein product [Vitrella brassicaformis CCMP3155]|eukprot:CEM24639.1 unnamed protein product [Vitrella brassicaformis CCMP3155]